MPPTEETPALTRDRALAVLRRSVQPAVFSPAMPVDVFAHHVGGEPVAVGDIAGASFEPFPVGGEWGPAWDTTWFRFTGRVPDEWRGSEVVLRIGLGYRGDVGFGAEGLVWEGGVPVQGISPRHSTYRIAAKAEGGEAVDVLLEAAANPVANLDVRPAPSLGPDFGGRPLFRLDRAELAVRNGDVDHLALDLAVLIDLYNHLPAESARAARVRMALARACSALDESDVLGTSAAAREALAPALAEPNAPGAHRLSAVGNAHIDTAWLWPFRETVRKCARTFSNALALMDDYPDYRFACSQPQQLAWVKERYPELYERIKARVAEGRFEIVGAMWVEADCNVPSGESLVRQILHGSRFVEAEFGQSPDEVWLPDVFGYAASLPQIMRRAGIERFLTQKLSWSTVNRIPHHTFWWEGIDGSRVLTHFPPADTYNGDFSMAQLSHNASSFRDHAFASRSLYLFGYGDGGGGPTRELLERGSRYQDLEGAPPVGLSTVSEFWDVAASELAAAGAEAPLWVGELYLEFHRGTYTTSAMSKRENRGCELLLREAELWSSVRPGPWASYPSAALDAAWKDVLLLQFHDVLPGTSIAWVYEDSARRYEAVRAVCDSAIESALSAFPVGSSGPVVFNAAPVDRREVIEVDGSPVVVEVPALGYAAVAVADGVGGVGVSGGGSVVAGERSIENSFLRVSWDDGGVLVSVWDKEVGREVLAPGCRGNVLQLFDDRPVNWDAWDVNAFTLDSFVELDSAESVEVVCDSSLVASVRMVRAFGSSRLSQTLVLREGSRRIDFVTEVDWQESRKLLKAAFPVAVHARRATYEIQYGHVERPTHRNTSWDAARFEVCGHKWADLSEPGYGVALLNDCKYGYDILGNVMRLSLLRAPVSPAPLMDRGRHRFTYSLLPHVGDFREAGVIDDAYVLNMPLRVVGGDGPAGVGPSAWGAFAVSAPGVYIEAVKRAEDSDSLIVRLYEAWGRHVPSCVLRSALPVAGGFVCDLLEHDLEPLAWDDGALAFSLAPFEILTLRLALSDPPR
jgi:alpha-mannosidase